MVIAQPPRGFQTRVVFVFDVKFNGKTDWLPPDTQETSAAADRFGQGFWWARALHGAEMVGGPRTDRHYSSWSGCRDSVHCYKVFLCGDDGYPKQIFPLEKGAVFEQNTNLHPHASIHVSTSSYTAAYLQISNDTLARASMTLKKCWPKMDHAW